MKAGFAKLTEVLANISIVIVAAVATVVLVKNHLLSSAGKLNNPAAASERPALAIGARLSLPDVNWSQADKTLLIALSKDCRFCSDSAPFYRRLSDEAAKQRGLRLIALFSGDVEEGRKYLQSLGVGIEDVRQVQFQSIGIRGTPSLILVDSAGLIRGLWMGRLSPDGEREVMAKLGCNGCP